MAPLEPVSLNFNASEYESLKQRDAEDKSLKQRVDELQEQLQQQAQTYESKIEELKKTVITANERSSRLRTRTEKDTKAWQIKVDRALGQAETLRAEHKQALEHAQDAHRAELAAMKEELHRSMQENTGQLEGELRECVVEAERRERALAKKHGKAVAKLQAEHDAFAEQLKAEAEMWRTQCEEATALCDGLRAQVHELKRKEHAAIAREQEQVGLMEDQIAAKDERLRHSDREKKHLEEKLQRAEDVHAAETQKLAKAGEAALSQQKAKQDAELDSLRARVSATLEKKDKAIADLRAQLEASQRAHKATELALFKANEALECV